MRLVNWRALVLGAAGFGLAACGDDVTVAPTPISFTTNPSAVTCQAGGTAQAVGVTVTGGSSGTPTVQFTAGNGNVTVTGSGTSASVLCTTAGASSVNFTITSGGQVVTGSIPVTVSGASTATPVTAVTITPTSATVAPGGSTQFTASVTLASGAPATTSTAVTFSSADTTVATVSATGLVTAKANAAGRSTVIRATSVANTNLVASATLTVGPASSLVGALTVSPGTVSLTSGQTQQITSNVTLAAGAPAGTSTGVTYTSSDTSIARVSSTGVITAGSRPGTATITVGSAAAPTVTQQVAVTVSQQAPVRLTVQSIETVNAAGNQVAIDPTNVAGRIIATLNLDPGSFTPDSVIATLGSQRVVCQRFTAQLAQVFREAAVSGSADFAPIQCTLNTSSFNATTGTADVLNGNQTFSATVYYRPIGGGSATSQSATVPVQLTLNNQSGYFVSVTNTPTAAQVANGGPANGQATGPQGVLWRAGTLNVAILPVNFGTAVVGTVPQQIAVSLSDFNSGQIATKTVTFTPGATTTVQFSGQTAAFTPIPNNVNVGCQCLDGYTSPNAGAANGGTAITVGGAANSVILNNAGVVQGGGAVVYIDNASPEARNQFVSSNFIVGVGGTSGFVNGSFVFSDSVQQAASTTVLADNNGVDRVSRSFFFANNGAGITAANIVSGGTTVTSAGSITQNPSQTAFASAARLADALGNAVAVPVTALNGGPLFTFGVITATPTIATVGAGTTIGSNGQIGITAASPATIQFQATSTSGVSFPTNFVVGTLQVVSPAGTFCATNADLNGSVLTGASTTATPPCPTLAFNTVSIDPNTARAGIYTLSAQSRDVAGNLSAAFTRTFVIDRVAPTVVNPFIATPPLTGGASETLSATATDNLGLVSQLALVEYPTSNGAAAIPVPELLFRYDGSTLGSALATPFTQSATLSVTVPSFIRAVAFQPATSATSYIATTNASFVSTNGIAVGVSDNAANFAYGSLSGAVVQSTLDQTQTAPTIFGGNGPQSLSLTFQASTASSATTGGFAATLASATGGTPTSETINLVQNGLANTPFTNQFARVELFARGTVPGNAQGANPFGVTTAYTQIATCSSAATSISITSSTITNSCSVVPGAGGITAFPGSTPATVNLLLVATTANGYSVAFVIPTITINP